jgi:hypothetical protein
MVAEEKLLLAVVGPVAPSLAEKVAAEVASYLFGSRFPTVEKPARGEVVRLLVDYELLVRSEALVRAMLQVTKTLKEALGRVVLRHRFPSQQTTLL